MKRFPRRTATTQVPAEVSPPQNEQAEQAVLGSMLLDQWAIAHVMEMGLRAHDFYHERHRRIHETMVDLFERGEPVDLLTVTDRLKGRRQLEDVGGAVYLTSLLDAVPTAANVEYYARIVRNDSVKRGLIAFADEVGHATRNGYGPDELLTLAGRMVSNLRERLLSDPIGPLERGRGGIESAASLLRDEAEAEQPWLPLWQREGLTGAGLVTLISGHSKVAGKTTSTMIGLRDLHRQRPDLTILYLSEEPRSLVRSRFARWGLDSSTFLVWFADGTPWPLILKSIEAVSPAILVIDTIRSFASLIDENDAGKVVPIYQPLVLLTRKKAMATLALHHLRKTEGAEGLAHAGSTALVALSDIALELRADEAENRRIVKAVSRFDTTPRTLLLEKRGEDILALGSPDAVRLSEVSQRVLAALPSNGLGLTREEAQRALEDPRPSLEQTSKALRLLKEQGRLIMTGEGKKGSPYRYHLTDKFHSSTNSSSRGGIE